VASRKKKLERMGLETNAKGHRFKLNRDRAGWHSSAREEIVVDREDAPVRWKFPDPPELRHHGPVVEMEGVSFGYERGEAGMQL
jgi:ATP-binding cassette subfamily F protein 3